MRRTPFFILCIILTLAFTGVFFIPNTNRRQPDVKQKDKIYLELWHVDTFEGGVGSRVAFLTKVAKEYEKKTDVCVTVKTVTPLSLENFFANGIYPDIASFGNGIELPGDMLHKVGKGRYEYAIPWCMGGYAMIKRKNTKPTRTIVALQDNVFPLVAATLSECDGELVGVQSTMAIYDFYKDKSVALIGTQRDLYRLEHKSIDIEVEPLGGYNDLYQYLSVISPDEERALTAVGFCGYLLSESVQKGLGRIGMLSAFYDIEEQPVGQLCLNNYEYTTKPLITRGELEKLRRLSTSSAENRDDIIAMLVGG